MYAFISYSTVDREWSSIVKSALRVAGFNGFQAHQDLQLSEEWKSAILEELKRATIFVAVLSKDFKGSDWCSQEIGFIISRPDVLIIPLSIDGTVPYGFFSHLQSVRVHDENEVNQAIQEVLLRKKPRLAIPAWIKRVETAPSYRDAEAIVRPMVTQFGNFTDEEAIAFATAALKNGQVWDAARCKSDYLRNFAKRHWKILPSVLKKGFIEKVEMTEDELD